ncbi:Acetolactate synthase isozyme 2 large subunit [compost metagenome]
MVERAFATALQGRMGPVVVALPENILHDAGGPAPVRPVVAAKAALDPAFVEQVRERLSRAERPMLILGGSGWTDAATDAISAWAERLGLPLALSFRRKDLIRNDHPGYAGDLGLGPNPKLVARVKAADLLLVIGARMGENPTQGYTLLDRSKTAETLIHIHPGAEELGRVWAPSLSAASDNSLAALALSAIDPGRVWSDQGAAAHADFIAFSSPITVNSAVNMSEIVAHLAQALPEDAILTNGAGNFAAWLHRFHRHQARRTQLAPTSGAMGYGYPAALGAKVVDPSREVVCIAGDGDFMMSANEMATAAQYGLGVIVVVVDNGTFGTIRMHQEREYPARVIATELKNPDFVKYAEAFDAFAVRCETTGGFPAALAAAREAAAGGRPALIHLITDAEQIAPGRTITDLRGA